ncbi:hypothetical protein BOX07_gp32 [Pseudoalteromonas phage PH1]|uniref:hypothetical protein n=1 Tax=Pseudoalteromonas phage PH1 TaxID=1874540 RepID=UPI0008199B81|nr:hypothetical protein BOX07_gp32 [Pseudoalteromonas phage PH1]ANY29543.1 hypothetical protein [Pseudoalteromonas phage PH1]
MFKRKLNPMVEHLLVLIDVSSLAQNNSLLLKPGVFITPISNNKVAIMTSDTTVGTGLVLDFLTPREHKLLWMATMRRLDALNTVRLEEHRKLNEQLLQELLR